MMTENRTKRNCALLAGLTVAAGGLTQVGAQEAAEDPTAWKSSAALGTTLTRGNSETLLVNGNVNTEKKWESNELGFGLTGTYGEDRGNVNAQVVSGFGQYNRLFTEKWFGFFRADALHDDIADVRYRVTLAPGVGYYPIKTDKFTLGFEAGPGFVFEELGGQSASYITLRFAERLTWKISDRSRLWQSVEYLPKVDDFGSYVLNAEIGIDTDITKSLSLRVAAVDTYRSEPAPGRKSNDLKLIAGIAYKF